MLNKIYLNFILIVALSITPANAEQGSYFSGKNEISTSENEVKIRIHTPHSLWWWGDDTKNNDNKVSSDDTSKDNTSPPPLPPKPPKPPKQLKDLENIANLEKAFADEVIGQHDCLKQIIETLRLRSMGLQSNGPGAVFVFSGSSGVGKSLVAELMAKYLASGDIFQTDLSKGNLYVPSSVIGKKIFFVDHFEKIQPSDLSWFLQMCQKGYYDLSSGTRIDCKNVIFILATETTLNEEGFSSIESIQSFSNIQEEVLNYGELIEFKNFSEIEFQAILFKKLELFAKEFKQQKNIDLIFDSSILKYLHEHDIKSTEDLKKIKYVIDKHIIKSLSQLYLQYNIDSLTSFDITCEIGLQGSTFANGTEAKKRQITLWYNPQIENELSDNSSEGLSPFSLSKIRTLEERLKKHVMGQDEAIQTTVKALTRYASKIHDSKRPIGTFLYLGPTGVGKTELAKALTKELFGDEDLMIRFDMSEFSEEHTQSKLLGSPPGYVGSEEGGKLTTALKAHPNSVVLFDEVEKAHPKVLKIFLQMFEDGRITSGKGETVNCRQAIFIMTSNLGASTLLDCQESGYSTEETLKLLRPLLIKSLTPELFNRIDPVIFSKMNLSVIQLLVTKILASTTDLVKANQNIDITFEDSAFEYAKLKGFDPELGARPLKRLVERDVTSIIAHIIVQENLKPKHNFKFKIDLGTQTIQKESIERPNTREMIFYWKDAGDYKAEYQDHPFRSDKILTLESALNKEVIGQPSAVKVTADALLRYAADIHNPNTPIATLLYIGPTGVGKTELVKALARQIFNNENKIIRLDMSEFVSSSSFTKLIGSSQGYVDSEKGGVLTEALKKNPCSIVLLDEIEKAHPEVQKLFLQVFDEGRIRDGMGDYVNCKNALFILTTNLGAYTILDLQQQNVPPDEMNDFIRPELMRALSPELYNRVSPIIFTGLTEESIRKLVNNMLDKLAAQIKQRKNITLTFSPSVYEYLTSVGYEPELGARPLRRLIEQKLTTVLAYALMNKEFAAKEALEVVYEDDSFIVRNSQ
jgi:ATP-dependent Clp protease ATP-binding subunit ClpA